MSDLKDFAQNLRSEILDRSSLSASGDTSGRKENIFTSLMIEGLIEGGYIEDGEVVYFSKKTTKGYTKANGYHFDDEEGLLNIYVTLYNDFEILEKNKKTEIQKMLDSAARFFDYALQNNHPDMEPSSDQYDMLHTIYENREQIHQVKIFLFTDGLSPEKIPDTVVKKDRTFQVQVWDIQRLFRSEASGNFYEAIQIDLKNDFPYEIMCVPLTKETKEYDAYLAILPGQFLCDIYERYSSRLLELNVRSFLQAKGKVNRGIRDTIKNNPGRFFSYNNGISATAEAIEVQQHADGRLLISSIKNLQIVNGGQTTASIHRAGTVDKSNLSEVYVQAKITVADQIKMEELVPKIARYANSQNAINEADFASNDTFHIELERLSKSIWVPGEQSRWFYERARGQYQVEKAKHSTSYKQTKEFEKSMPPSQKFTKTDLAKFLNSWNKNPHTVSKGAQANFTIFISDLKDEMPKEWIPDEDFFKDLICKEIIFKEAYKIIRAQKFPGYNANIVTYTVAYLAYRIGARLDLEKIWNHQSISSTLHKTIENWCFEVYSELVKSAAGQNVTQWCKKEACWTAIKKLDLNVPLELQEELLTEPFQRGIGNQGKKTQKDYDSVAKIMSINADMWFEISKWGREGGLNAKLASNAHKLSGYAAGHWKQSISTKLAYVGIKILEIASDEFPELKEIL